VTVYNLLHKHKNYIESQIGIIQKPQWITNEKNSKITMKDKREEFKNYNEEYIHVTNLMSMKINSTLI
jgi:hypothetical protein